MAAWRKPLRRSRGGGFARLLLSPCVLGLLFGGAAAPSRGQRLNTNKA